MATKHATTPTLSTHSTGGVSARRAATPAAMLPATTISPGNKPNTYKNPPSFPPTELGMV
ncbi:MAG: hypothetical protein AAFQ79_16535 [Pseudomonadota bacterium]